MPPTIFPRRDPAYELLDWVERRFLYEQTQPLWLGGEAGSPGSVGPPGGYIGLLPQDRVHYDPDELEYSGGSTSLKDNLAHDRYRLTTFMEQLASYEDSGGSICSGGSVVAGEYPSWGSGAWIVGFSPGSPDCAPTVQDAIQYVWNNRFSGIGDYYTKHAIVFTIDGDLDVEPGGIRVYAPGDMTIDGLFASLGTPAVGADAIFDVNVNGASIGTVTITAGEYTGTASPSDPVLETGDYLTVDVDQRGTTTPGANASVQVMTRQYVQED